MHLALTLWNVPTTPRLEIEPKTGVLSCANVGRFARPADHPQDGQAHDLHQNGPGPKIPSEIKRMG
jgi:hypothetical protein